MTDATPTTPVAVVPAAAPEERFQTTLERFQPELAKVAPSYLDVDRTLRIVLSLYKTAPKLNLCTTRSILVSVMQASTAGLDLDPYLGEAYLIPRENKALTRQYGQPVYDATLMPGYQGLMKTARRSGQVVDIEARVIHEHDTYTVRYGLHPDLIHEPFLDGDPGQLKATYCVTRLKNGHDRFTLVPRWDIDALARTFGSRSDSPWKTDYEAMALKTAVKREWKWMPKDVDMASLLRVDTMSERDASVDDALQVLSQSLGMDVASLLGKVDADTKKPAPVQAGSRPVSAGLATLIQKGQGTAAPAGLPSAAPQPEPQQPAPADATQVGPDEGRTADPAPTGTGAQPVPPPAVQAADPRPAAAAAAAKAQAPATKPQLLKTPTGTVLTQVVGDAPAPALNLAPAARPAPIGLTPAPTPAPAPAAPQAAAEDPMQDLRDLTLELRQLGEQAKLFNPDSGKFLVLPQAAAVLGIEPGMVDFQDLLVTVDGMHALQRYLMQAVADLNKGLKKRGA